MKSEDFIVELMDLIKDNRLCGISIGDPVHQIQNIFGSPELPKVRLGRRSKYKLWSHLYGNLSFVSDDNDVIVSIDIDLHGNRRKYVDALHEKKSLNEWMIFFAENNWNVRKYDGVISANSNGISISFSLSGKLEMVSLH